ncbi:MAG: MFS transporter [Thermodesulfobacteriota bacterium]
MRANGSEGLEDRGSEVSGAEEVPFRRHLGSLFFLAAIFFLNFISRIILGPLMPTIEEDMNLGHGEAGSLFLLISSGYSVVLFFSGAVSSRLTHKRTILLSSLVMGVTLLLVSQSRSLGAMRLGLVVMGMAGGLYLPSGIASLTAMVSPRHWGKAIAIHELAPNIGFVAAPFLSEFLLGWLPWRGILGVIGGVSIVVGLGFARFGKGGGFSGEAPSVRALRSLTGDPSFWVMMLLFSLAIGGSLGVYAMLPLYLVSEKGMEREWANTLVALSRITGIGMAFVAGWAVDHLGAKRSMAMAMLGTGLGTLLLGLVPGGWTVAMVFLQPMVAVCFFPAGFSALSRIGGQRTRNVAISLTIPVAFLVGGGGIPAWIGFAGEMGSFEAGMVTVGALTAGSVVLMRYLRLGEKGE